MQRWTVKLECKPPASSAALFQLNTSCVAFLFASLRRTLRALPPPYPYTDLSSWSVLQKQ